MRTTPNGWQVFVATLLMVIGAVNVIQGTVALFSPGYYVVEGAEMLYLDFAAWGTLLGLWGAVLIVAGLAVLSGSTWARAFGIVLAALNALAQVAFLVAMPLWSMIVIAVDVLVIYGLTAGWPVPVAATDTEMAQERTAQERAAYRSGHRAAHAAPKPAESSEQTSERRRTV